ncbi:MAG: DNA recombination protein RmuC [bacterium]|nr:DNA recombination protein RmuC [bacterium]
MTLQLEAVLTPEILVPFIGVLLLVLVVFMILLIVRASSQRGFLEGWLESLEKNQEREERLIREELSLSREEAARHAQGGREELRNSLKSFGDSVLSRSTEIAHLQKDQLDTFARQLGVLTRTNEEKLDHLRESVEGRLKGLQEENSRKLDQMRAIVDEKLHETLEKRLGESFKFVSERLELVHKGLGEMQTLAAGVGDLKRVLTNVKTRGTWGEIQLGTILAEVLNERQYERNVATRKGSSERVEFAVKFPGRDESNGTEIWLPIDAKYPQEDYERLLQAQEAADARGAEDAGKQLETGIKASAKAMRDKYIDPPSTTDFGIMFLPTEGLYAEVLRRPGLFDHLQREFRITVAGPSTMAAFLNSLQMGFRTLAIEKRSSEVWAVLGAVKTEFGKFGAILERTRKQLQAASNTIDSAARKTRTIERKLKKVEELPSADAAELIGGTEELE